MNEVIAARDVTARHVKDSHPIELTTAGGLGILILVAAAVIRFVNLGVIPLSPDEAQAAWAVWALWRPEPEAITFVSPAYFSLTSLITPIAGYADAVMRLVPAIFGLGTVGLAWLIRHRLGQIGTLLFMIFLAVSPLNAVAARTAGGFTIAEFSVMLMFVAWLRYQEMRERRWLYLLAAALGLGLSSSALFFSGLLTMMLARLIQSWLGPKWLDTSDQSWPEAADRRRATLIGGIVFVTTSALFLWYPAGLGAAVDLPVKWLSQFSFSGDGARLLNPLLAAGRYEPLILLPGAVAIIWAVRQEKPLGAFCVYWIGAILGLILLQRGQVTNALLITLPAYLLVARFANDILVPRVDQIAGLMAVGLSLAGGLILINIGRYSRLVVYQPEQLANIWMALLIFAISVVVIYLVATWDLIAAYQGTLLATLLLFTVYYWGNAWWLSHQAANDPRARWASLATDDEVRLLQGVARDLSRQFTGTDYGLQIVNVVDTPVLRWYLREFSSLENVHSLPSDTQSPVLISQLDSEPLLSSDYVGADFGLVRNGQMPLSSPSETPLLDTIRWWLFHETNLTMNEERVILWWRADLDRE